jgi:hypothetical protein
MAYDNGVTFDSLGHAGPGSVDYVNVIDRDGNPLEYEIPRWKANFKYKRRYSPAIAVMMDSWDGDDPWGSAVTMGFAVYEVSRALDIPEIAHILQASPGMTPVYSIDELADSNGEGDIQFETMELASAVRDGRVTDADLIFAAKVLNRYIDICRNAGKDY